MFTTSPDYATLAQQVASNLEREIRRGVWRGTLPGERLLSVKLQVSRRTIRAANAILRRKKLVQTAHGKPTSIVLGAMRRGRAQAQRVVGLLLPRPLEEMRPGAAVIDYLRPILQLHGFRLETHLGRSFLSRHPDAALERLVTQSACDGWIVASANRECQAWFFRRNIPAVVIGTAHEGIALPYVDIDMYAASRHAANMLLRRGHRRLAIVIENMDWAGFRRTERGFTDAIRDEGGQASVQVLRHAGTLAAIRQLVTRVVADSRRPSAMFIVNPLHYIAVSTLLTEMGVVAPRDISLVCRDDDVALRFLSVEPTRYAWRHEALAKELFSLLKRRIEGGAGVDLPGPVLILPELVAGASVATVGG